MIDVKNLRLQLHIAFGPDGLQVVINQVPLGPTVTWSPVDKVLHCEQAKHGNSYLHAGIHVGLDLRHCL
jgi:hypothetical protein